MLRAEHRVLILSAAAKQGLHHPSGSEPQTLLPGLKAENGKQFISFPSCDIISCTSQFEGALETSVLLVDSSVWSSLILSRSSLTAQS